MEIGSKFALLNVSVVDGKGGWPEENKAVIVKDGIIHWIGHMKDYKKEDGVQEVSLDGFYVMPGMIDAHVHLAGGRGDMEYQEMEVIAENKLVRAMRSVYEAQAVLKRGFTSVRDVSWNGLYLKRIFGDNTLPGPRVIACGPGLSRTGGHADLYQYTEDYVRENGFWSIIADGPEEIRKAVRRVLREGADQVKIWASGGDNWPNDRSCDVHYSMEEIVMCVEEAHRQEGTFVCAHAENRESISMCVDAGVDTIEHGEDLDEELAVRMAKKGVILVPTLALVVNWHKDFVPTGDAAPKKIRPDVFLHRDVPPSDEDGEFESQRAKESFQLAVEKGVKIALGSDTVYEPLTKCGEYSAREFKALVECGLTVPQAIRAATMGSAEALNMSHKIGTVEVGKEADLLVVRKDPTKSTDVLYNAENIYLTFIKGRLTVEDGRFVW